jgi:predicted NAD/FAD-binding protein
MRVAVVGTGISGMVAAYLLSRSHDVVVFEANDWVGGHAHTVSVNLDGETYDVDTGFVVYNERTYPNFSTLLERLGVRTQPTEMSFSVRCEETGFEYSGGSLAGVFAQRRNLFRPGFHRLLRDILRFNREAPALLDGQPDDPSIGDYLNMHGYSREFRERYLIPMAAAVWSTRPALTADFPARYLVRFFLRHGFLQLAGRPQWRTITGGARRYVEALTAPYRDRIRLECPVERIRRHPDHVDVTVRGGVTERFDRVVVAVPGARTLGLLEDPTPEERDVLSAFADEENELVLHTDASLLPASRRAWASWNAHLDPRAERVTVTYDMSRLQRLASPRPFCITLNRSTAIDPRRILRRFVYRHPLYTREAIEAQTRHRSISGVRRTYYCGAYWGYGFHEDGVNGALAVAREFGEVLTA